MIPTLLKDKCKFDAYEMLTLAKILKASILGHNDLVEFYLSESSSQHNLSIINAAACGTSPTLTNPMATPPPMMIASNQSVSVSSKKSSLSLETHHQIQQQRALHSMQHTNTASVHPLALGKQISPYNNHHHHHHHFQKDTTSTTSTGSSNNNSTGSSSNNNNNNNKSNNNNNNSISRFSSNYNNSALLLQSAATSLKSSSTGQSSPATSASSTSRSTPMPQAESIESGLGGALELTSNSSSNSSSSSSNNGDPDATVRLLLQIEQLKVFIPQVTGLFESIIELYKNSVDTIMQK